MMTSSNGNIFRVTGLVRGIHRSPVNSPHKGQWRGVLMLSMICAWTNGWANNRDAGDLSLHRAHFDVTAMMWIAMAFLHWGAWIKVDGNAPGCYVVSNAGGRHQLMIGRYPCIIINQSHKSHCPSVPYLIMHHSKHKCAHFRSEWCIVGYGNDALWDSWDRSIPKPLVNISKLQCLLFPTRVAQMSKALIKCVDGWISSHVELS